MCARGLLFSGGSLTGRGSNVNIVFPVSYVSLRHFTHPRTSARGTGHGQYGIWHLLGFRPDFSCFTIVISKTPIKLPQKHRLNYLKNTD